MIKKSLIPLSVTALFFSGTALADPRIYPEMTPREHFASQQEESIEQILGKNCETEDITEIDQSLYVNVPGYYVNLTTSLDGQVCSTIRFPVRVGRHWERHLRGDVDFDLHTPAGEGWLTYKGWTARFRRSDGSLIERSNTFTPEGEAINIPMPYDWMRSLHMRIVPEGTTRERGACTFHATTDEHTIGTPASHCCIGLTIADMLELYSLVNPEQRRRDIEDHIPVTLEYNLVEFNKNTILLYADIYKTGADYEQLIRERLSEQGFTQEINDTRLSEVVEEANEQMNDAYLNIRRILARNRFISREDASGLQYQINIKEILE